MSICHNRMSTGAILEFYNSATVYMYLAHNIRKNKVNCVLLFLLHVNDDDRYGSFDNTFTKWIRQSEI